MKSIVKIAAGILSAALLVIGTAGCQQDSDSHEHTFATAWTSDATNHWHAATCEHTTEVSGKAAHTFGEYTSDGNATTSADGTKSRTCSVCGYKDTVTEEGSKVHVHTYAEDWSKNATDHWHAATCEHTTEVSGKAAHTFVEYTSDGNATTLADGTKSRTCSVCGYKDTVTDAGSRIGIVATPTFSVAAGAVNSGTEVTISCGTEGAVIHYTTDGSEPTAESTTYSNAISITPPMIVKAIAVKSGMNNSAVASAAYTVKQTVATPTFSVAAGAVNSGTTVTISCATEGAVIHYTTYDFDTPTAGHQTYSTEISIEEAQTIKAIAVKDGMNDSEVASASYTIKHPVGTANAYSTGFVKVTGASIKGNETWIPYSNTFLYNRAMTIPTLIVCDHEVTRGEFKTIMGTDPSKDIAYDKDGNKLTGDGVLNNPVNQVTWYMAIAYCNKLSAKEGLTPCYSVEGITDWENLAYSSIPTESNETWDAATCTFTANGYRLPTEAEWEWLARGGEDYRYAGSNTLDDVAWYAGNTGGTGTREVKTKAPNGYGLYDMSGNVWEWCWDWFESHLPNSTPPEGPDSGTKRIRRSGCYWVEYKDRFEVKYRFTGDVPACNYDDCGFRVVRTASAE